MKKSYLPIFLFIASSYVGAHTDQNSRLHVTDKDIKLAKMCNAEGGTYDARNDYCSN